ncbi:sugar transferase [Desulfonatronovibrio magnus]|uniref:sugar transferase n=1 Tax=Desulfonatronovibrio magnus TaxID=698827 RepID=UPI0005EB9847|nr:sugar transferase [Desulfonatronovibrio magnus]
MYRQQVALIITLLMVLDGFMIVISGYSAMYLRWLTSGGTRYIDDYLLTGIVLFVMFASNVVMGGFGLYSDRRYTSILPVIKRISASVIIVFSIVGVALYGLKMYIIPRGFLGIFAVFVLLGTVLNRAVFDILLDKFQSNGFSARRIMLAGDGKRAVMVCEALMTQKSWGHKIIGYLSSDHNNGLSHEIACLGKLEDFNKVLQENSIDEVIFALEPEFNNDIKSYLDLCEKMGIPYRIVPALFNPYSPFRLSVEHIQDIPALSKETTGINASGLVYKRLMDFLFGIIGFLIFCLMYPIIAIAIKIDSPGPVLFRQQRVGRNNRIFWIYKFRTMYIDAEERKKDLESRNEMNGFMFKMENDPRVTKVGRFLRKSSLDEFPQFINVVKGEMSLVGTRPPTLDEVKQYEVWQRRRISMKPGITGLWQVSGRNKISDFNEVVKLDLQYIDQWKFIADIKILLLTLWVVMRRKGAV